VTISYEYVYENQATGTTVGYLSALSQDSGDTHTFTKLVGSGPFDIINGNQVITTVVFNYEDPGTTYPLYVRVQDASGQYYDGLIYINILNVNEAPYGIVLYGSIPENSPTGTTVGSIGTSDPDAGDTFTYTLLSLDDYSSFTLSSAGVLKSREIFNYEYRNSYTIYVTAQDAGGLTYTGLIIVPVTNVNETPTDILLSSLSISENVPTGTTVGTFSTDDPDYGNTFTYSLVSGVTYPDNVNFYVSGSTLKSNVVFNYEYKNSYNIRVKSVDGGGLSTEKNITISISNVTIYVDGTQTQAVTCFNGSNGIVTLSGATGGSGSYTYSKDGTNYQSSAVFSGLTSAGYTFYAKDSYGEVGSVSVTVTQPNAVMVSGATTNPTCYSGSDGSITINSINGGSGTGYQYSKDSGANWQTGTTFSSLSNATYTIYAKDSNSCTGSTVVTLNRTQVSASTNQTNIGCYGGSTGQIVVSGMSGGQGGPYSIKLNVGGTYQTTTTSRTYSSLAAGSYTVYVKDSADCERTISVTLTQPATGVIAQPGINVPPTCYDGSDGEVAFYGDGGTSPYTYSIDGITYQASGTFSGLSNGSYTGYVKDANGCVATITRNINRNAPSATATITNVTCNGGSDGKIVLTSFTNGSSPYRVSTNDGSSYTTVSTSFTYSGLTTGNYTIYIKDGYNCIQSYNYSITQPSSVTFSASLTNPTCYNSADGSIVVSASGGSGGYQYSLNNGGSWQSSNTFSGLAADSYLVKVKDSNGCMSSSVGSTLSKSAPTATISASSPSCYGGTGSISVSGGSGGSGSGYQAKNGSGGTYANLPVTYSSLGTGTYTIYIKDGANCVQTYSYTITVPSQVTISRDSTTPPTCWYNADGQFVLSSGGGTGTKTYSIDGTNYQSSGTFSGLGNGTYTLYAKDENGCIATTSGTLNTSEMVVNFNIQQPVCHNDLGQISMASVSGGSGLISSWTWFLEGTSIVRPSNYIYGNLNSSPHTFTIYDGNGCSKDYTITLTNPSVLTASISSVVAATSANNDGQLTMSSTGGVWPKTYYLYRDSTSPYNDLPTGDLVATYTNVTSGSPDRTITTLSGNYYWLLVVDANGCSASTGEIEVPKPVAVSGFVEVWYGSSYGTSGTACSMISPSYYLYYKVGDPNNGLSMNQRYYNSNGTLFDGSVYEAMSDGTYFGTIDGSGKFRLVGTCP